MKLNVFTGSLFVALLLVCAGRGDARADEALSTFGTCDSTAYGVLSAWSSSSCEDAWAATDKEASIWIGARVKECAKLGGKLYLGVLEYEPVRGTCNVWEPAGSIWAQIHVTAHCDCTATGHTEVVDHCGDTVRHYAMGGGTMITEVTNQTCAQAIENADAKLDAWMTRSETECGILGGVMSWGAITHNPGEDTCGVYIPEVTDHEVSVNGTCLCMTKPAPAKTIQKGTLQTLEAPTSR